jgi:hypothetical protein
LLRRQQVPAARPGLDQTAVPAGTRRALPKPYPSLPRSRSTCASERVALRCLRRFEVSKGFVVDL